MIHQHMKLITIDLKEKEGNKHSQIMHFSSAISDDKTCFTHETCCHINYIKCRLSTWHLIYNFGLWFDRKRIIPYVCFKWISFSLLQKSSGTVSVNQINLRSTQRPHCLNSKKKSCEALISAGVFKLLTLATSNCRTLLLTFSARVEVKETMLDSCLESVSKIWRLGLSKMKDKNIKHSLWFFCNGIEKIMTKQTGFQAESAVRCSTNWKFWHQWLNRSDHHTLSGALHAFDF